MAVSYLELTNQLLVRLNEAKLTSTTFANARGLQELAKNAINDSIFHIHDECEELSFLYVRDVPLSMVIGENFYLYPTSANKVDFDNFYIQANSSQSVEYRHIDFVDHNIWKRQRQVDDYNLSTTDYKAPDMVFRTPDDYIGFSPLPDKTYVILYNYWKSPSPVVNHGDTTDFPDKYSRIIVDGAEYYLHKLRKDDTSLKTALERFKIGLQKLRALRVNRYTSMSDTRVPSMTSYSSGYIDA